MIKMIMKIIMSSYSANPYPYRLYNTLRAYTLTQAHPDTQTPDTQIPHTRRIMF